MKGPNPNAWPAEETSDESSAGRVEWEYDQSGRVSDSWSAGRARTALTATLPVMKQVQKTLATLLALEFWLLNFGCYESLEHLLVYASAF